jgi:hypothetical protein
VLRRLVVANRDTWFGHRHHFDQISDPRQFQTHVPPATDADFAEPIRRIAAGEANVLTREPVRLLEPTSGTISGEKLIPYTTGLLRQFQRGVAAWVADLFLRRPAIRAGRAYWSLSPALVPPRRSPGGLPIGFAEDTAYLGRLEQFALRRLLAVPQAVMGLPDLAAFRYATLRFLLAAEDLAFISVWSPTFLTTLLALLPAEADRLCRDIERGTLTPPGLPQQPPPGLGPWLRPDPARARRLHSLLHAASSWPERLRAVWPRLALVSCWGDAAAAQFLPELQRWLSGVEIQPKGLIATEGFVSLPLVDHPGAALAVRSHFIEFEEPATGRFRLAQELERGGRYRVVLSTAGGLYRYNLGDEIEVVGFRHQCPLLRFLGKSQRVSDLVGEKLAEPHVRAVLAQAPRLQQLAPTFTLLVPVPGRPPRYRLYLQGPAPPAAEVCAALAAEVQAGLGENPYYRHAVALGQLAPLEVMVLDPAAERAWLVYERYCVARGQKCGDIKPAVLDRATDWPQRLAPLLPGAAATTVAG